MMRIQIIKSLNRPHVYLCSETSGSSARQLGQQQDQPWSQSLQELQDDHEQEALTQQFHGLKMQFQRFQAGNEHVRASVTWNRTELGRQQKQFDDSDAQYRAAFTDIYNQVNSCARSLLLTLPCLPPS